MGKLLESHSTFLRISHVVNQSNGFVSARSTPCHFIPVVYLIAGKLVHQG